MWERFKCFIVNFRLLNTIYVHLLVCYLNIPPAFAFKLTNFNNEVFHQLCPDSVSCYFLGQFKVFFVQTFLMGKNMVRSTLFRSER